MWKRQDKRIGRELFSLDLMALVMFIIAGILVIYYAPLETIMGQVQKIFYFHVAAGWIGMVAFSVAALAAIGFLRTKSTYWDRIEYSAIEIGMAFGVLNILSGMIWAKPIWNTWWTWDPRLTTVAIMILTYAAYLILRNAIEPAEQKARFCAVYALLGFASIPLTFLSIRLFRTIHPVVIGGYDLTSTAGLTMSPKMSQTFIFCIIAFSVLFIDLLLHRVDLEHMENTLKEEEDALEQNLEYRS